MPTLPTPNAAAAQIAASGLTTPDALEYVARHYSNAFGSTVAEVLRLLAERHGLGAGLSAPRLSVVRTGRYQLDPDQPVLESFDFGLMPAEAIVRDAMAALAPGDMSLQDAVDELAESAVVHWQRYQDAIAAALEEEHGMSQAEIERIDLLAVYD